MSNWHLVEGRNGHEELHRVANEAASFIYTVCERQFGKMYVREISEEELDHFTRHECERCLYEHV